MPVQGGSSANLARDSWGDLDRTFKGLRSWVGELSGWYRTSCDEHCSHHSGYHTARIVDDLLGCCCPRPGARPEDNRIRQVATSTHLGELENVSSQQESKSYRSKGCPERRPFQRVNIRVFCEPLGRQGLGRGASRNGGEINLEEPEPKEPELALESKHRRVVLEGKHSKPLCLSTHIRQEYLHSMDPISNLLFNPSSPN